jgi:hypothetical protein
MSNRKEPGFVLADFALTLGLGVVLLPIGWLVQSSPSSVSPGQSSPRIASNELAAVAALRSIASAQARLASSGAIDTGDDGVGEYGYLGELKGTARLRVYDPVSDSPAIGDALLTPPLLPPDFGNIFMDTRGDCVLLRNGYVFKMFLPDVQIGQEVAGIAEDGPPGVGGSAGALLPSPDTGASFWGCYAWPLENQVTGHHAFFVNQQGHILQTRNDGSPSPTSPLVYDGLWNVPAFDAAYSTVPESPEGLTGMGAPLGDWPRTANDGNDWTPLGRAFVPDRGDPESTRVVLGFDDLDGQSPDFLEGTRVQPEALIDTRYSHLGVVFDAPGGGIFVAKSPANSISGPNAAGATSPGPRISYSDPATATFWSGDVPAVVHYLRIRFTGSGTVTGYGLNGAPAGTGTGGAITYQSSTGIHSVRIDQAPLAFFDDFTFADLEAVHGFALSPLFPARAGTTNELHVMGGRPGETVLLEIELDAGSLDARSPAPVRTLRAAPIDADGRASVRFDIPAECAGMCLRARAFSANGESTQTVQDHLVPALQ